jgi:hypothetical protein
MSSSTKEIKSLIASLTPEQKAVNISALTYIKTLASQSNVNIYDWNLLEIFTQEDGINLVSDKKLLNKRFFDHLAKIKSQPKPVVNTVQTQTSALEVEVIKDAFVKAAKNVRNREIQSLKDQLWSQEDAVRRSQQVLDESCRLYTTTMTKIHALEQVTDVDVKYVNALKGIQKLVSEELWVNPVFENGYLYLNTNTNIMLHNVNKTANLDLHVDLGQLAVRININSGFNFEVIPYRNNLMVESHYHPHVRNDAHICWGEAQTVAYKNIANIELEKALRLLHNLLNSYNPGSPYKSLDRFKVDGTKLTRVAEHLKHPDKRKKKDEVEPTMPVPPAVTNGTGITGFGVPIVNQGNDLPF